MEETVKQRLMKFIAAKGISLRTFAKMTGLSSSYITNLKSSPSAHKMNNILNAFPDLDMDWLMTGEGSMLKGNISTVSGSNNTSVAGDGNQVTTNDLSGMIELQKGYQEMIKEKDSQIARLISVIEKLSDK